MKTTLIILFLITLAFLVYFFILGYYSKSKEAPALINNQLSKCPDTKNCCNTEFKEQSSHYVPAIKIVNKTKVPISILKTIIQNMNGEIKIEKDNYLSAIFSSSIFGFIDDLEIRIDRENNLIHLRSASRVGRSDLGVNKKRILLIKKQYKKLTSDDDKS